MPFSDLERLIDRELAGLPAPRAPRTLAPRVMRAISTQPGAQIGAWYTWPVLWQASSLAAMVLVFAGILNVLPMAAGMLSFGVSVIELTWVGTALRLISDIVGAAGVVWRILEPVAIVMLLFLAAMFAASAMFGAALRAVVLGGTSRP